MNTADILTPADDEKHTNPLAREAYMELHCVFDEDHFAKAYEGAYPSRYEYKEYLVGLWYGRNEMSDIVKDYIDEARVARDMLDDYDVVEHGHDYHLFRKC